ncbi:PREDICTED: tumor necrosis factor-like [Nanorana parkeri]|uniref:tumor necrosis factor-like n=1 Tax=Nanorana parkeri TaxID=125878 RepID=UPI0008545896|nr:PREDICTED: tumor necrosis factor-like [Nanorana parkeri]
MAEGVNYCQIAKIKIKPNFCEPVVLSDQNVHPAVPERRSCFWTINICRTSQSTAKTKDHILQWEWSNGLAFVGGGMLYENKSIKIPKEGFYFVYSQVSLKIPSNFGEHFVSQIVRVNSNYGDPEILFSGKAVKNGQQTIYLAGLLHLIRGDQLKVNVTAVDQVDIRSNDKTFFGAFWVMDKPRH